MAVSVSSVSLRPSSRVRGRVFSGSTVSPSAFALLSKPFTRACTFSAAGLHVEGDDLRALGNAGRHQLRAHLAAEVVVGDDEARPLGVGKTDVGDDHRDVVLVVQVADGVGHQLAARRGEDQQAVDLHGEDVLDVRHLLRHVRVAGIRQGSSTSTPLAFHSRCATSWLPSLRPAANTGDAPCDSRSSGKLVHRVLVGLDVFLGHEDGAGVEVVLLLVGGLGRALAVAQVVDQELGARARPSCRSSGPRCPRSCRR